MPALAPVDLLADCPACRLESGAVERYDHAVAACRFGVPAEVRCRLCDAAWEGRLEPGRDPQARSHEPASAIELATLPANRCPACRGVLPLEAIDARRCPSCGVRAVLAPTGAPIQLGSEEDIAAALDRWAAREGLGDRQALLESTFVDPSTAAVWGRLARGEPIETLADPFALAHGGAGGGAAGGGPTEARPAAAPPAPVAPVAAAISPPRALVYPLVSVIAADGEIHPSERALLDRFLAAEGIPPLADEEIVVHPPAVVARHVPPDRRERLVELMCETAMVDGMPDASEKRVVHAYASAWSVPPERVDAWAAMYHRRHISRARSLWLLLRHYLLVAPWGSDDTDDRA